MLAIVVALAALQQPSVASTATHWEHTLIRHEKFEDFDGGSGEGARMAADKPLTLNANMRVALPGDPGPQGISTKHVPANYESRVIEEKRFNEALISWNVDCPVDASFAVELRVGRAKDEFWSPWLAITPPRGPDIKFEGGDPNNDFVSVQFNSLDAQFEGGRVDVDCFRSPETWDRIQYRLQADCNGGKPDVDVEVIVRRVVLCLSRRTDEVPATSRAPSEHARIAVPFRSQRSERSDIAGKICSPTSLAMVMAYRGVDVPTSDVAARVFDKFHEIYGNWPLNVQGAYGFGVPAYLARFSKWSEVEALIAAGQPLVISIAAKEGELDGAPYKATDGHLLVLCGFDAKGDALVNDPAAVDAEHGQVTYRRDQIEHVWMQRGGTAYVLEAVGRAGTR